MDSLPLYDAWRLSLTSGSVHNATRNYFETIRLLYMNDTDCVFAGIVETDISVDEIDRVFKLFEHVYSKEWVLRKLISSCKRLNDQNTPDYALNRDRGHVVAAMLEYGYNEPSFLRRLTQIDQRFPDIFNVMNRTRLFWEHARHNRYNFLRMMIETRSRYPFIINFVNDNLSLLSAAIFHSHHTAALFLLSNGARGDFIDSFHGPPIYTASYYNASSVVAKLLSMKVSVDNRGSFHNDTALHAACQFGYLPIVTLLLRYGADIQSLTNRFETPLHLSAREGQIEIVKELLKCGALLYVRDEDGLTAMEVASREGHQKVVNMLRREQWKPRRWWEWLCYVVSRFRTN